MPKYVQANSVLVRVRQPTCQSGARSDAWRGRSLTVDECQHGPQFVHVTHDEREEFTKYGHGQRTTQSDYYIWITLPHEANDTRT